MLHNMRVLAVGDHFFITSKLNKTSCFKSRHFINIYIINRTLHGRLGIRILSSRAESISHSFASLTRERYLQHSKIKFVSPRGHVISSISLSKVIFFTLKRSANLFARYLVAQFVEHRAVTREVVSSTPAGLTLRVFK